MTIISAVPSTASFSKLQDFDLWEKPNFTQRSKSWSLTWISGDVRTACPVIRTSSSPKYCCWFSAPWTSRSKSKLPSLSRSKSKSSSLRSRSKPRSSRISYSASAGGQATTFPSLRSVGWKEAVTFLSLVTSHLQRTIVQTRSKHYFEERTCPSWQERQTAQLSALAKMWAPTLDGKWWLYCGLYAHKPILWQKWRVCVLRPPQKLLSIARVAVTVRVTLTLKIHAHVLGFLFTLFFSYIVREVRSVRERD